MFPFMHQRRAIPLILLSLCMPTLFTGWTQEREKKKAKRPEGERSAAKKERAPRPDFKNVKYGPHQRNVYDLWLPKSDSPTPLVLYIHGGGFQRGDKGSLNPSVLKQCLEQGWAVAAINYRLTDTAPAPAAYLDCARAVQHLRHNAKKWKIDKTRVASTGNSAGAGTSLWLAFHDDLADPKSDDPVARESTRLTCAAVHNGQSSYDPRFAEKIGIPRPNFEKHSFFFPYYGIEPDEIDSPKAYERYTAMAPITYLTKDDPPVLMTYNVANVKVTSKTKMNTIVHHPLFGISLKKRMDELGLECVVQYLDAESKQTVQKPPAKDGQPITVIEFLRKQFETAKR